MLTIALANRLLDHAIGRAAWPMPAGIWLAAFTAAPTVAGGGTEASWGGYARLPLPPASLAAAAEGVQANVAALTFAASTGPQQTVTHIGTFDAAAGGTLLEFFQLTDPVPVLAGQRLSIAAGEFVRRGVAPAPSGYAAALDFSDLRNSQFVPAFAF